MSDFLEFDCPACGRPHLVDGSELSREGAYRACPHCGSQLFVDRSGARAEEPPQETSYEGGLGLSLRMPGGGVERLSSEAIQQGIEMQRILPWDLVSEDGREFHPIQENPEFRNLFVASDFTVVMQSRCANHKDALAAATCRKCGRSYCASCVSSFLKLQPRLCPACGGGVSDPDARLRELPPWQRLNEVARFPVDANAWIVTLATGVLIWVPGLAWFLAPLYLLALGVFVDAMARSSKGAKQWNVLSGLSGLSGADLRERYSQWLPIAVLSAIIGLPFLLIPYLLGPTFGVLVQFPITLFLFFYFPMAAGLLLLADDKDKALKPRSVLQAIWALRDEYFVYLVLFIAVAVAVVAVSIVTSFIPWIGAFLQSIALAYGWILQAHLLGFFLYMNRERVRATL